MFNFCRKIFKSADYFKKVKTYKSVPIQNRSFCNLLEQPKKFVQNWLQGFDTVIADGDGVLWNFNEVIKGSPAVLNRFKELDKNVFICTNNSAQTRRELCEKAQSLGYDITLETLLCSAHVTASYLRQKNFKKSVYLIGNSGISQELKAVGIEHNPPGPDVMAADALAYALDGFNMDENVGAVIVGLDVHFNFVKLLKAATYLQNKQCLFLATNPDVHAITPTKVVPGAGSLANAVQTCSARTPLFLGKPNREMCKDLIEEGVVDPARTLMIGDNCETDVHFGHNCGFQTLLVGTGKHQPSDVRAFQHSDDPKKRQLIPDMFLPRLGDLLCFMK